VKRDEWCYDLLLCFRRLCHSFSISLYTPLYGLTLGSKEKGYTYIRSTLLSLPRRSFSVCGLFPTRLFALLLYFPKSPWSVVRVNHRPL